MVFYRLSSALGGCDEAINGGHCYFDNRVSQGRAQLASSVGKGPRLRVRVADGGAMFLWNERHNAKFSPTPPTSLRQTMLLRRFVGGGGAISTQWQRFTTRLHQLPLRSSASLRWLSGPKTVLLQRLEGQHSWTVTDVSRPRFTNSRALAEEWTSAFCEVSTPRFRPAGQAGRSTRDLQQSDLISGPIYTDRAWYAYSDFHLALIYPPNASCCSTNSVLEYEGDAETTAHSQALLTSMVWPRSDLSLHNSILSNPAPGGVALGGQIGQADTEATAQSLWMEPCVPGIIGFSVDLLQLLGWSRR